MTPSMISSRVIVHVNGELVPANHARVSVFDRGFLFGDGIYEGLRAVKVGVDGGSTRRVIAVNRHGRRLQAGLDAVGIAWDASRLPALVDALLDANHLDEAFIYWQVTRGTPPIGAPPRSRVPVPGTTPTAIGFCTPLPGLASNAEPAIKHATVQADIRWQRGEVKSISLLGNILVSLASAQRGGDEAILVRDGLLVEGAYTNVLLVTPEGTLVTPALDSAPMLAGVTRRIVLDLEPSIIERPVRVAELETAREILLVGTTTMVTTVGSLDGRRIGDGKPGPHARRLLARLVDAIARKKEDCQPCSSAPAAIGDDAL